MVAAAQCYFVNDPQAHIYGTPPHNQRIEGWWSYLRRSRMTWWMNFFKDLIEQAVFTPGNQLQIECLWFCFSSIIQQDLDFAVQHWNSHCIRRSRHDTISGRPDELFCFPECNSGKYLGKIFYIRFQSRNASMSRKTIYSWKNQEMSIKNTLNMSWRLQHYNNLRAGEMLFVSTRNCSCMLPNKCTSCFGKQLVLNACLQVSNKAERSTACTRSLPVVRFHWILTRGSSSFCVRKCFSVSCHIYRIVTSYKYSSSHTPRMTGI